VLTRTFLTLAGILVGAHLNAGELVCLKSGFCLRAESHAVNGERLSFRMGVGTVEFALGDIASIQAEAAPPVNALPVAAAAKQPVAAEDPRKLLAEAADAQGIDPDFVRSVAHVESRLRQAAISNKGAIGLMQLMPGTAKELAVDPNLARQNALGGARYLRELLLKYHSNSALALAAYNAGPSAVSRYGGVPPYTETRQYVLQVTREYDRLKAASHAARKNGSIASAAPVPSAPAPQAGTRGITRSDGRK
jgi:soluble lytic murein transglycosylase-like protein